MSESSRIEVSSVEGDEYYLKNAVKILGKLEFLCFFRCLALKVCGCDFPW